jgi:hypothetical protein
VGTDAAAQVIDLWNGFAFDNPAQTAFLRSPAKYRLLSSGRGGGKSVVGCRESIKHAVVYPGSKHMISRLHFPDLERSTHATFKRELAMIGFKAGVHYRFLKQAMTYEWLNFKTGKFDGEGSLTIFTNLDDEEKFGSVEVSTIFIDEGSEVPRSIYEMLFPANLRWPVGPHRAWFCTNPGASGYLRAIVSGELVGSGQVDKYGVKDDFAWFPVPIGANKHNPGNYNAELDRLGKLYGPHWYARYVEGSWDFFEGQRFPMLERDVHVLPVDFRPEPHHEVLEGWDFGWAGDTHVTWTAIDPHGEDPVIVFAELAMNQAEPETIAGAVHDKRRAYNLDYGRVRSFGDPAGRSKGAKGRSWIDLYAEHGIYISPADASKSPTYRADRIAQLLSMRRYTPHMGTQPGMLFNPSAPKTFNSVRDLQFKQQSSGGASADDDPREVFLDRNKHGFDSLGYGLNGYVIPSSSVRRDPVVPIGVNLPSSVARKTRGREEWVELD